jgi:enoyl-CoA hydratase/carnithine racemase
MFTASAFLQVRLIQLRVERTIETCNLSSRIVPSTMALQMRIVRPRFPPQFGGNGRINQHPNRMFRQNNCQQDLVSARRLDRRIQRWASMGENEPQVILKRITLAGGDDNRNDEEATEGNVQQHPNDQRATIAQITLNRPKANAMGIEMIRMLRECLDQLEDVDDTTRCVVLTSHSDKVFSAGADLKERATMNLDEAEEFVSLLRGTMERVAGLPIPVIAAVEGVAVGGGFELALAADIRIASIKATLGLPETSLAIIPGAGGTQRLPRLIGAATAKELIWTGRRISGEEAYSYGLVQHVVPPGEATNRAIDLAFQIASNGPVAIRASKEAIQEGEKMTHMNDALEIERRCYAKVLPTSDRLEGLAAFREGRTPHYKGY